MNSRLRGPSPSGRWSRQSSSGWMHSPATRISRRARHCCAAHSTAPRRKLRSRAVLDAWLRRSASAEITLDELARHAASRGCSGFAAVLRHGLQQAESWTRRHLPSQWVREFSRLAATIGWPGAGIESGEHQAAQRWQSLLAEFGASDDVTGPITASTALSHLRELAASALFEAAADQGSAAGDRSGNERGHAVRCGLAHRTRRSALARTCCA